MADSVIPVRSDWWIAAPSVPSTEQVGVRFETVTYRPANALAWATVLLLGLSVALTTAIAVVVGTSSLSPYDVAWIGTDRWQVAIELLIVRLLLWVATPVAWFLWFDRVLRNVEVLGGGKPESTRLGAVGWWFVPVASNWKPARAVGDVYGRLSIPGTPGPWLPVFWWVAWIGATLVPALFGFVLGFGAGIRGMSIDQIREGALWLDRIGDGLEVVAGILAIAMVIAIQRAQAVRAARIADASSLPSTPWEAPGPERPVPAHSGSLPARSLIVAGAIIAFGLMTSAVVAQNRPAVTSLPAAAPPSSTASPAPVAATPSPSPSPTLVTTAEWTVTDRLREKVLDAATGFSARIAVDGSMRFGDASVLVRAEIDGSIVVSGRDFRGRQRVRSALELMRSDTSVAVVGARVFVRDGNGPWSTARAIPDTFGVDPLYELRWSHDLVEIGPGEGDDSGLTRIRWPLAETTQTAIMKQELGAPFEAEGASVVIFAAPDGTPVRVDIEVRGTYPDQDTELELLVLVTYRYSDVGEPITVEAPGLSD